MDKKILFVGLASLLLLIAVGTAVVWFAQPAEFRGASYVEPYPAAPEMELTRSDGSSFRLSEMRGEIVLVFFGYTTCPDVCPATLAELNQALSKLADLDAAQVKVVFVTVDPERDSPELVQEYVERFNPAFVGLGGSEAQLAQTWQAYGVFREIVQGGSAAGYLINHTARVTLIDRQGNLRVSFGFDTPVEDIVHDLKLVLDEQ